MIGTLTGAVQGFRTVSGLFSGLKMALVLGAVAVPFALSLRGCAHDVQQNMMELGGERVRSVVAHARADFLADQVRDSRARVRQATAARDEARADVEAAEGRIDELLKRPATPAPILEDGELTRCPANCLLR